MEISEPPAFWLSVFNNSIHFDFISALIIFGVFILVFLSAMISGSEVAFFSIEKSLLQKLSTSNDEREKKIYNLLIKPKKLLATILIFNNIVNISIVSLLTIFVWRLFQSKETPAIVVTLVTTISTFLIVFFGELLPKVYANQSAINFSKKVSPALTILNKLCSPVAYLLVNSTNFIENKFSKKDKKLTTDELVKAIEITTQSEDVSQEEKEILKGIANFNNINAKQIMQARTEIDAIDIELHFHELMDKINKTGFSRIPIYEDTIDTVVGILYIKDLLPFINEDEHFNWRKYIKTPYFIPESKKINDLLKSFQQKRVHMAIVVDEYGGTSGIVTLEDIIEEIVGEINDEFDEDDINFTKLSESEYVFEGKTSLTDFCKLFELENEYFDEVKGESESLGGLMLELFNKIPHVGQEIESNGFNFKIESVSTKRVKKIKVINL